LFTETVRVCLLSNAFHQPKAGLREGPTGQLLRAPNYKTRYDVTEINGNIVLAHSGFAHTKEFHRKFKAMWAPALTNIG